MKFANVIIGALACAGLVIATGSPTLVKEKRATSTCVCETEKKKREINAAIEPALIPALPVIDTANTPDPSKDNCLKQLEQYGNYADPRCMNYGAPVDLINSYRGGRGAPVERVSAVQ
ncbi:hypothetical protein TWF481_011021 [Arthrobotrys musiformis]|uniref:Uncharacterized protein n=1 Tax=Arthrobotrys musiformis TaxID=47236 RepID=A0AAV9W354_9PEZI